jgi:hypothetical protein
MEARNLYDILGAAEDSSQDELERLYKRLAKQYHPDRGGNVEDMRAINEAYQVLGSEFTRRAYDSQRQRATDTQNSVMPPAAPRSTLIPSTLLGRFIVALLTLLGGLVFLFGISLVYLRFMWPILLIAVFVIMFGIWKLHEAILFARKQLPLSHLMNRYVWVQEVTFWCMVALGAYLIYTIVVAI